jgi:soluble lytic murein transglycosylase-like protein
LFSCAASTETAINANVDSKTSDDLATTAELNSAETAIMLMYKTSNLATTAELSTAETAINANVDSAGLLLFNVDSKTSNLATTAELNTAETAINANVDSETSGSYYGWIKHLRTAINANVDSVLRTAVCLRF